jgi:hypothetical protein
VSEIEDLGISLMVSSGLWRDNGSTGWIMLGQDQFDRLKSQGSNQFDVGVADEDEDEDEWWTVYRVHVLEVLPVVGFLIPAIVEMKVSCIVPTSSGEEWMIWRGAGGLVEGLSPPEFIEPGFFGVKVKIHSRKREEIS